MAFSPETMDFLWGIRFNNDRTWFAAHKEQYLRTLYEPMKALSQAVAAPFLAADDQMRVHLSRIYRDMRMHPPTYYKDSLWFCIQRPGGPWLDQPNVCFEINPEGYRYGFLFWNARVKPMAELRQRMNEDPERFLSLLRRAERKSGLRLDGDHYAKPKPCTDERLLPYFRLKNFFALEERPADELLFSDTLADFLQEKLLPWLPMCDYCSINLG